MLRRPVMFVCIAALLATACGTAQAGNERVASQPQPRTGGTPDSPPEAPLDQATKERPRFEGGIFPIGSGLRERLVGRNWHPGCPVSIEDLRLVRVSYWNFEGDVRTGPLVLHEGVAADVLWVFKRLFRARFPIEGIKLAAKDRPITPEDYWDRSRRSVTASFNCRPATGSTTLSQHSYGWAVDINPLQNPYVRNDGSVLRRIAKPFRDRSLHREGMIHEGDIVVRSFARIGWEWGGHWHTLKDYMHFSLTGR
jgi:hypothetical protein